MTGSVSHDGEILRYRIINSIKTEETVLASSRLNASRSNVISNESVSDRGSHLTRLNKAPRMGSLVEREERSH